MAFCTIFWTQPPIDAAPPVERSYTPFSNEGFFAGESFGFASPEGTNSLTGDGSSIGLEFLTSFQNFLSESLINPSKGDSFKLTSSDVLFLDTVLNDANNYLGFENGWSDVNELLEELASDGNPSAQDVLDSQGDRDVLERLIDILEAQQEDFSDAA